MRTLTFLITTILTFQFISAQSDSLAFSIGATRMNILYYGLDNPVTIAVPETPISQVYINAKGAALSGGKGKYTIKPANTSEVILSVFRRTENGGQLIGEYTFRVKKMPSPVLQWCGELSGGKVTGSDAGYCSLLPVIPDFDFEMYCTVISYSISYSLNGELREQRDITGNQIPKSVSNDIKQLKLGSKIYFEDVKVKLGASDDIRSISAVYTVQ